LEVLGLISGCPGIACAAIGRAFGLLELSLSLSLLVLPLVSQLKRRRRIVDLGLLLGHFATVLFCFAFSRCCRRGWSFLFLILPLTHPRPATHDVAIDSLDSVVFSQQIVIKGLQHVGPAAPLIGGLSLFSRR